MLRKLILFTVIILLMVIQYFGQSSMMQWKIENQVLNGDEVRSWQIALDRYGRAEKYRYNHIYSADEILQENNIVKKHHEKSFFTQITQRLFVNIDSPHPNLYYALLRISLWRGVNTPKDFLLRGVLLNLVFYAIVLLYLYRLYRLLFGNSLLQAILILCIYSLMMGHLANLLLIRMYYLSAMALLIFSYYLLRSIKEQSFTMNLHSVPRQPYYPRFPKPMQEFMGKLSLWRQNTVFPSSALTGFILKLYSFCSIKSLRYYRVTVYLSLLFALYLSYSSHYFSLLAVGLWGIILLLYYRKDLKATLTYIEILLVSIFLMAISQVYFLYNLATATHTSTILHGGTSSGDTILTKLWDNIIQSFISYVEMWNFYFIPWQLLLSVLSISALAFLFFWYKKKKNNNSPSIMSDCKDTNKICQIFLCISLLILPYIALFLSPVGKAWRIIVPYTPLFVLLFPLMAQTFRKDWLKSILLVTILGYYAMTYPSQMERLQQVVARETVEQEIPFMYVVNRPRDKNAYFYTSIVRLLSDNYLRKQTRYQYFDTVANIQQNSMDKRGYILIGPYMISELKYLQEKFGLQVLQEYPGNLYAYLLP